MDAICGILGKRDAAAVRAMANAMKHRGHAKHVAEGDDYSVAWSAPIGECPCLIDGTARSLSGEPITPAALQQWCASLRDPAKLAARGHFAAAVRAGNAWWLIRDRFGTKPLYYAETQGVLLFASELKALLAAGYVEKRLNLAGVDRYLTLRCAPGPESIIQGVYRVPPGHVIEYGPKGARQIQFAGFDLEVRPANRNDAAAHLREILRRALGRTAGDSLLWSAGIDCAALAALKPGLRPFFVQLKSAWQEETRGARESARLLSLHMETAKARRLTESAIAETAYALDEPLADASALPWWLIAEQAGEKAPVLLSGHGADELLGGFPRYHFLQKAHGAKGIVPVNFFAGLLPALPPNAFLRRGGRYLSSIHDNLGTYLSWLSVFDMEGRDALYTDTLKAALHEKGPPAAFVQPYFSDPDLTRDLLAFNLNVALPELLLAKCDRIAAAHGLSLELPYFDDELVDFAIALPPNVKFGVRSKPLLRQALKGIVPTRVRLRARRDFRVPQSGPTLRVIEGAARAIVTAERVDASGLFKWPVVEQVVRSASHNVYHRRQFWALLMFFAWYRAFMET